MLADLTESLPEPIREHLQTPLGIGAALLVLGILVFILAHFSGKLWGAMFGAPPKGPQDSMVERLAEYPPAPGKAGPRRLTIGGVPGRLRLVVIAPVGRSRPIDSDKVNDMLNIVVRGLKEIIQKDKPRVRVWAPQLSNTGFAPTFHRLAESPDADDEPSQWVRIAGPANASGQPILIGLAVFADDPTELGKLTIEPGQWAETVRVVTMDEG